MCLDVLFKILRPLECLTTTLTSMWFEWYMYSDVRSYVVAMNDQQSGAARLSSRTDRLTVVILHLPQAQVRFKLFVDLRPICASHTWLLVCVSVGQ